MSYKALEISKIEATISQLQKRILERFPKANLGKVCDALLLVSKETESRCEKIKKPNMPLRIVVSLIIGLIVLFLISNFFSIKLPQKKLSLGEFVQLLEAGIQAIALIGATIIFLVTAENRFKRKKTLKAINELRSMVHVIDMHQLTKDPERVFDRGKKTSSSPEEELTPFELTRYLDYCSEMLSLIGKTAALYGQDFSDSVVLSSINEIETLTTGLSRKIWQKIMIIHSFEKKSV